MLGGKEITKTKKMFFVFYAAVFACIIYSLIGAPSKNLWVGVFYLAMMFGSLAFVVYDMLTEGKKENEYIDTVLHESNAPVSLKKQLIIGGILSAFIIIFASVTGQAFLKANPFGITFSTTPIENAFLSGLYGGVIEVLFFFSFLYPTLCAVLHHRFHLPYVVSVILGTIAITGIFVLFHNIVYRYDQPALLTVAMFGLLFQALPIAILRSNVIPMMLHFTNNFIVVMFVITKFSLLLVF